MIAYVTVPHGVPDENYTILHLLCMYETKKHLTQPILLSFAKHVYRRGETRTQ